MTLKCIKKNVLMSPHVLTLKVGVLIILLQNISPPQYCNGTRLLVKQLIETTILNGKFKAKDVPAFASHPNDSNRYALRIQMFAVSGVTGFSNDH
jgi:hypothetical protein